MGMLTIPFYFLVKYYLESFKRHKILLKIFFSFFQIISPLLIYAICFEFRYKFYRGHFALFFSIIMIFLGLDYGIFTNIILIY